MVVNKITKDMPQAAPKTKTSINLKELFSRIEKRAYEIYQKRGHSSGSDLNDWLEAERQVKRELNIK